MFLKTAILVQIINPFWGAFNTPHQTAPFNEIKNEHYEPAFERGMKEHDAEIQAIINNPELPNFKNTIEALERAGELLNRVSTVFFALESAESDDEMMEISQRVSPLLSAHSNNINLNEKLFERIKSVYDKRDALELSLEEAKLLDDTYQSFVRRGANLNDQSKDNYRCLSSELSTSTLTFGQNILKETNQYEMLLTKEEELAGLPEDVRVAAKMDAKEKGKEGWLFTLSAPSYIPFMKYSTVRSLREKLYRDYTSRCAHGGEFDNRELMVRIAELRLEMARLLGYETYADFTLQRRMANDSKNVYKLLDDLAVAYTGAAKREVEDVKAFAQKQDGSMDELMPWDWAFYAEQLKKEKYDLDDELLRPYFELGKVKEGVFGLATSLWGITFKQNKEIPVYHPDVEAYEVFDKDGSFLSVLYTDFHPRAGKRNGAWMTNYGEQYKTDTANVRPHVTIVMNFTKPTESKPSLLTFDEFQTFLHEFGHALHGMFADSKYASLSGTNVYRDFVELPSQILENWSTQKEYLDRFAIHYKTGEPIPAEYIERIRNAATYLAAYSCLRQLSFGYIDMAWHTLKSKQTGNVQAFENTAMDKVRLFPVVEGSSTGASFAHIFAGGYAAGYYSYKWAEVLDADAFAYFLEKGIFNQELASAFRREILSKGGVEHPMELYKRFRGTEPSIDALLKRDKIK